MRDFEFEKNVDFNIGDIVAFNYSGAVKVGKIIKVGKDSVYYDKSKNWKTGEITRKRSNYKKVSITVQHKGSKGTSLIKNPESILKLDPSIFD